MKSVESTPELRDYVTAHSGPIEDRHRRLVAETRVAFPDRTEMQITPEQGVLLRILVRVSGARRVLEVGTFTGLSAMFMAEGLPSDGRIVCLDVSEEFTAVARRHWQEAGLGDRIELRLGPASESLAAMAPDERFDLAFVDADKPGYPDYYEAIVPRIEPGGLLVFDNTLRRGRVARADAEGDDVDAVRRLNERVASDPRVEVALLPFADGVSIVRRRRSQGRHTSHAR